MLIGVLSGTIAAVITALLSLPLHSPDDIAFNTATVSLGALIAGLVAGALHAALPPRAFAIAWSALFAIVAAALVLSPFDGLPAYGLPLAAVVFSITGLGVHYVRPAGIPNVRLLTAGTATAAAILGVTLVGQGDGASGSLSLPAAPSATTAAAPSATTAATLAPTATAATTLPAADPTAAPAAPAVEVPRNFSVPADLSGVTFIVGEGSEAAFTVNEKIAQFPLPNDAVIKSTALSGEIRLDGRPSTVSLDLQRLSSDQSRRDGFVRRMFRSHPTAVLTVPALVDLPERYEAGQIVTQTVEGTLALYGAERPVTFHVEARLDGSVLYVLAKTSFTWSAFNIPPPNTPSVQVQDNVAVEVLLAARPETR